MPLALRLALAGALGTLLAWLIAEPFAYTAQLHGTVVGGMHFTIGSFFGWFAHATFGAFSVGAMATVISLTRMRRAKALLWGAAGFLLGGLGGWLADRESDVLCIKLFAGQSNNQYNLIPSMIWSFLVAMSLAAALALTTQPTLERIRRVLLGGVSAGMIGFTLQLLLSPVVAILAYVAAGGKATDSFFAYDPSRLIANATMASVLGLSLGVAEILLQRASLKVVYGSGEEREFPIAYGVNRIGSAEGLEVSLLGDLTVRPVHAVIQGREGEYWLQNTAPGALVTVNGEPITSQRIEPGDVVGVGGTRLVFEARGAQQPANEALQQSSNEARPQSSSVAMPRFVDTWGNVYLLATGEQEIGRDAMCAIHLTQDLSVARRHAKVEVGTSSVLLSDLESPNGTFVNGEALSGPTNLNEGDQIRLGQVTLTFRQA